MAKTGPFDQYADNYDIWFEINEFAFRSELSKNVITYYTFTKTYAMTAWRIDYIHADEEIIA